MFHGKNEGRIGREGRNQDARTLSSWSRAVVTWLPFKVQMGTDVIVQQKHLKTFGEPAMAPDPG